MLELVPRRSPTQWVRSPIGMTMLGVGLIFLTAILQPLALLELLVVPLLFFSLTARQLGGLLAARLMGFHFYFLTLGPLKLARTRSGELRLRLNHEWSHYLGAAQSLPDDAYDLRRRLAIVQIGGQVGMLLGMLIPIVLVFALLGLLLGEVLFPPLLLLVPIVLSLAGGAVTEPLRLLRGGPRAERSCATLLLAGAARAGRRPRDCPPEWIGYATSFRDNSLEDMVAANCAYYWALDTGQVDLAGDYMDRMLACLGACATLPGSLRARIAAEGAYYTARYRGDTATARTLLAKAGIDHVPAHERLRAEAALLLAEGDRATAGNRAAQGLVALGRLEDDPQSEVNGGRKTDRDLLYDMLNQAAGPQFLT